MHKWWGWRHYIWGCSYPSKIAPFFRFLSGFIRKQIFHDSGKSLIEKEMTAVDRSLLVCFFFPVILENLGWSLNRSQCSLIWIAIIFFFSHTAGSDQPDFISPVWPPSFMLPCHLLLAIFFLMVKSRLFFILIWILIFFPSWPKRVTFLSCVLSLQVILDLQKFV